MKTYSVLIAWDDDNPEEGQFGETVRAESPEKAEALVREAMRTSYTAQFAALGMNTDAGEPSTPFGGRLIEIHEGAIWQAKQLENALRALLDTAFCSVCHAGKKEAIVAARKLIAEIEAGT